MAIKTLIFEPDDMPEEIKLQVLSFMRIEWPQGFTGKWRGRRWISRPEFNPLHFVLMDDDLVVAHAESMWRDWEHRSVSYRVYGISGVFVYPDYQGEGYGRHMIQAVTAHIASQPKADIGMLWCSHDLNDFYIKCGWMPMTNTTTMIGPTESQAMPDEEETLMMQFYSQKGQDHRQDFENNKVYFGWTTW